MLILFVSLTQLLGSLTSSIFFFFTLFHFILPSHHADDDHIEHKSERRENKVEKIYQQIYVLLGIIFGVSE